MSKKKTNGTKVHSTPVMVDYADIVKAYKTAASNGESANKVAERVGLTRIQLSQRAARLRKSGVSLPFLAGEGRKRINVDELNAILEG